MKDTVSFSASTMEPSEQNIWKWMDNEQDEGENS